MRERRAQSAFEGVLIAGLIIIASGSIMVQYFSAVSDQTTAIVILKAGLLEEFSKLEKKYLIVSSLEPTLTAQGKLCFDVRTRPDALAAADINTGLENIKGRIAAKTRYAKEKIDIMVNTSGAAC